MTTASTDHVTTEYLSKTREIGVRDEVAMRLVACFYLLRKEHPDTYDRVAELCENGQGAQVVELLRGLLIDPT